MFFLKQGDEVFLNKFKVTKEVDYFRGGTKSIKLHGMVDEMPFCVGSFYGFGYNNSSIPRYIYVKKRWHYLPAIICEFVRQRISGKMAKRLRLER